MIFFQSSQNALISSLRVGFTCGFGLVLWSFWLLIQSRPHTTGKSSVTSGLASKTSGIHVKSVEIVQKVSKFVQNSPFLAQKGLKSGYFAQI